jgi:hypothetical protein
VKVGVLGVEVCDRLEGRSGLGSGGCALSDSVRASAAARSAARAASCGVVGAAGGACEGAVGTDGVAGTGEVSLRYTLSTVCGRTLSTSSRCGREAELLPACDCPGGCQRPQLGVKTL